MSVVLINAMLDLGHKIIIQNTIFKCFDGSLQVTLTALINACILLPFITFFTPAGYFADRYSKSKVMTWTVGLSIPITGLILLCYWQGWFLGAFMLTLILAAHSAFYSPAKYGCIKELVGDEQLSTGNAAVQSITIIAILLGGILFSVIFENLIGNAQHPDTILKAIAPCGFLLVLGACLQTWMVRKIPDIPAANPSLRLHWRSYWQGRYLRDNVRTMRQQAMVWFAILALTFFWSINQVLFAAFGAYLKETAGISSTIVVQGVLAIGGIGIMVGSLCAGKLSTSRIETGLVPVGMIGMTLGLLLLPLIHHPWMLAILFAGYGFFGGLMIIPLNALIQHLSPPQKLGTIQAGNNFMQNIGMLFFLLITVISTLAGLSSFSVLWCLAILMIIATLIVVKVLATALIRLIAKGLVHHSYQLSSLGCEHIPASGGVLLLGNHTSWIDWAILYLVSPRPIRFVMTQDFYDLWYLRWFLDLFDVIPLSAQQSKSALRTITKALRAGDCVALFPEGAISRNGQLGIFRRGYQIASMQAGTPIVPFYIRGLWGSRWSSAGEHYHRQSRLIGRRRICVCFGEPLPSNTPPSVLKQAVHHLSVSAWHEWSEQLPSMPELLLRGLRRHHLGNVVSDGRGHSMSASSFWYQIQGWSQQLRALVSAEQETIAFLLPESVTRVALQVAAMILGKKSIVLTWADTEMRMTFEPQGVNPILLTTSEMMAKLSPDSPWGQCERIVLDVLSPSFPSLPSWYALWFKLAPLPWLLRRCDLPCDANQKNHQIAWVMKRRTPEGSLVMRPLAYQELWLQIRQLTSVFQPRETDWLIAEFAPLSMAWSVFHLWWPLLEGFPLIIDASEMANTTKITHPAKMEGRRASILCTTADDLRKLVCQNGVFPESLRALLVVGNGLSCSEQQLLSAKTSAKLYQGFRDAQLQQILTMNVPDIINPSDQSLQQGSKPSTLGLPLPGVSIRVKDQQTKAELPVTQVGEIWLSSCIWADTVHDNSSSSKFTWINTGRLGFLDEDGFLCITV